MSKFTFTEEDLKPYEGAKPPFGELGAPTYMRTYSRPIIKDGAVVGKETFLDTIKRVIEGNVNLGIKMGDPTATKEWALKALKHMFNMSVMPPGRGYWMMGTDYAERRGGDALNNCWYTAVRPQSYEHIEMFENQEYIYSHPEEKMVSYPFVFMFDRAMLGGGVGFGASKKNVRQIPHVRSKLALKIFLHENHPDWERIRKSEEWDRIKGVITTDKEVAQTAKARGLYYFATDDREGWNISVRETIDAHFYDNVPNQMLVIDLSRIRQYGALIKGFGGTASGPLPLIAALVDINNILNSRYKKHVRSVDVLDMMNLLGRCVVAGNVRRTALIALGDADDVDYVEAKNYKLVDRIMVKDENGFGIWEANEEGKMEQKKRPFDEVVSEIYEELYKKSYPEVEHIFYNQHLELLELAEEKAKELYDTAFKQANHRWASNNSVYTHEMFDDHHFIAAGIIANGEPGVGNEWLMKNFGRIKDGFQEAVDGDAEGLNPCAEITLEANEPCNLVEFVPIMAKRAELDFQEALEIATQYAYRITFAKYSWRATQRVIEKNRRIGVSITGIQDYFLDKYGRYAVKGFKVGDDGAKDITKPVFDNEIVGELDEWYDIVKSTNMEHSVLVGANPSIKVTTVKPSGTVAKLPGVSSGIHFHYSPYMIQRIRFHETDPQLEVLKNCGYHIERAQKEPNTWVVEFPVKNVGADNPNFKSAGDVPLEEQFANQFLFSYIWADNAVSATLTFQQNEVNKIEPLLKAYNNKIKSTSLLPYSGHGYVQAPWEPITKERYEEMKKKIIAKPEDVYHLFDMTKEPDIELLDSECAQGGCPAK